MEDQGAPKANYPDIITPDWIVRHGACDGWQEAFAKEWGKEAISNRETLLRASDFITETDIDWFANQLLNQAALLEYEEVKNLTESDYRKQLGPELEEYRKQRNLSPKNDDEWQSDPHLKEFKQKRDLIRKEVTRKRAMALADIIFGEEII